MCDPSGVKSKHGKHKMGRCFLNALLSQRTTIYLPEEPEIPTFPFHYKTPKYDFYYKENHSTVYIVTNKEVKLTNF